jgi:streptomycin 6-kinase
VVPEPVRRKAYVAGATAWLDALPALVADLEHEWAITVGASFPDATEAFVASTVSVDGTPVVLKLMLPRSGDAAAHEITVLRLANGAGCVQLLRSDASRGAMLLESLGPSLSDIGLPLWPRLEILCEAAREVWRPAPDCGLPTGADKGRWLIEFIESTWVPLGGPCSRLAVDHALECATRRIEAHSIETSVLVHGDVHQWNCLASGDGFKLIDPDGLLADPAYDLGVLMREDPVELMAGDPFIRASWLGERTGLDPVAIWEWGVVERVSTGLTAASIDLQPIGAQMLAAADRIAADWR